MKKLAAMGVRGIEAFNNMCYKEDSWFLAGLAAREALVTTGGSDYHGGEESLQIGYLKSGIMVPYSLLESLKKLRTA